jgi:hypothetical protein
MPSDLEMALGWSGQIALFLKGLLIILREKRPFYCFAERVGLFIALRDEKAPLLYLRDAKAFSLYFGQNL